MSVDAAAPCEAMAWDSEFWGFPIARVVSRPLTYDQLDRIDAWCHARQIACVWLSLPFDDPTSLRCAEDGRFRLVDGRVTWIADTARPVPGCAVLPPEIAIREAAESDIPALGRMAAASFQTTRFYFDLNFPRDKCAMLYERWISESCRGFADYVGVAEIGDAPAGYVSCHLPSSGDEGRMGLLEVAPHARRRGVGRHLLAQACRWFHERNVPRILLPTQARNVAIQSLCARCGLLPGAFDLSYHKWFYLPGTRAS